MLLIPAQKGFSMVTQYLLENNANPNIPNKVFVLQFVHVCHDRYYGEYDPVLYFHLTIPEISPGQDGVTPLMAACWKGQRDVVRVLLASGADVTAVSVKVRPLSCCV